MKTPVYYAKDLCKNHAQSEAALRLLATLLARRLMRGERLAYWERKWGRPPMSLYQSVAKIRSLLIVRERGGEDLSGVVPDPVSLRDLEAKEKTYAPILDDLERDAVLDLDNEQVEALIRQMFDDEPRALFAFRRSNPKRAPKRKPGRPPGSKNKPKAGQTEEGWLMPDGQRIKL